jgi:hypothetical protein
MRSIHSSRIIFVLPVPVSARMASARGHCRAFSSAVGNEPPNEPISATRWGGMTREEQMRIWCSPGSLNELAYAYGVESEWTYGKLRDRYFASLKSHVRPVVTS